MRMLACVLCRVCLFAAPWTIAHQAPGSVGLILQARRLEWVVISFSRGSFPPRDRTSIGRRIFLLPLSHLGSPHQRGWAWSNWLRAWGEQKDRGRRHLLSLSWDISPWPTRSALLLLGLLDPDWNQRPSSQGYGFRLNYATSFPDFSSLQTADQGTSQHP